MLNNSNPIQNLLFVSRRLQNANDALSRLANQMRVYLALAQSGVSNFALVGKKLRKNAPCLNQSAISNFALYVIKIFKDVRANCFCASLLRNSLPRHALSARAVGEMWRYIALVGTLVSMHGFNSLKCSVTPYFLLINHFLCQLSTF